ncbi:hypothetical protein NCCP691_29070 [Noviherbaspirillum aridicola]|uniref:Uncharacterized protein n=1 Tax=Noviherbaspirillum aridicola TaxID=2849687 RepID=A0ABQ4Q6V6_9BURK|nr:hypothetical protein NCCP691_29070 [Noviherbaspirillum aridicola]
MLATAVGAGAAWGYGAFRSSGNAGDEAPAELREQLDALTAERDKLSTLANAAESQLNMEKAAQKQLAAQLKTLETENARLKEDLAFFESLLPNAAGPQGVAIRRLKVDHIAPNQLRYRVLIMQGGAASQLFSGNLQLLVSTVQEGRNAMMTFPDRSPAEQQKYALSFRHYQRVEGVITLPEGVTARSVQARVLEKGQLRAQLSANL